MCVCVCVCVRACVRACVCEREREREIDYFTTQRSVLYSTVYMSSAACCYYEKRPEDGSIWNITVIVLSHC